MKKDDILELAGKYNKSEILKTLKLDKEKKPSKRDKPKKMDDRY